MQIECGGEGEKPTPLFLSINKDLEDILITTTMFLKAFLMLSSSRPANQGLAM